jgi:hypothetical protein
MHQRMKWHDRIRRTFIISTLFGVGLIEAYYLPLYGIQWLLGAILATTFCRASGFDHAGTNNSRPQERMEAHRFMSVEVPL